MVLNAENSETEYKINQFLVGTKKERISPNNFNNVTKNEIISLRFSSIFLPHQNLPVQSFIKLYSRKSNLQQQT